MTLHVVQRGAWNVLEADDSPNVPLAFVGRMNGTDAASRSLRLAVARAVVVFARPGVETMDTDARRALVERAMRPGAPVAA